MQTMMFTPLVDDRKAPGIIASRIGLEARAIAFDDNFNFFDYIGEHKSNFPALKCILIDEAQFLKKKQVAQLAAVVDHYRLPVLTYGLRSDFLGEPFEGSKYLLAWAEEVVEIKTICFCGSKATMNLRVDVNGHTVREGAQVEIGGNDRYLSMCRKHFLEKMQAGEPSSA